MANHWLDYVFQESPAKGSARLVLLTLADRADDPGVCFPGIDDIAQRAALSVRRTWQLIADLQADGELVLVRRGGGLRKGGQTGFTNTYLIRGGRSDAELEPIIARANPVTPDRVSAEPNPVTQGAKGVTQGAEPCHPGRRTLSESAHKPTENQRCNPHKEPPVKRSPVRSNTTTRQTRRRGLQKAADLFGGKDAGAAVNKNSPHTINRIIVLLGDRGCDHSFRNLVAKSAPIAVIQKLVAKHDQRKANIHNPGGWWRDQLRRAGVKGLDAKSET